MDSIQLVGKTERMSNKCKLYRNWIKGLKCTLKLFTKYMPEEFQRNTLDLNEDHLSFSTLNEVSHSKAIQCCFSGFSNA